jgi:5'-deoxynucleotidase YfbR-like HD superfamily hydrolase
MSWMQSQRGRAFDLLHPRAEMVDLDIEVPEALARTGRFTNHVPSGTYSVAQHCVLGAETLFRETGRADMAAAFLLHDAHEAYMGDIATPVAETIAELAREALAEMGIIGENRIVEWAIRQLKARLDTAIHARAGVAWPLPAEIRQAVRRMDVAMLQVERLHLLAPPPQRWDEAVEAAEPARLRQRIRIWPWPFAAEAWREALELYLPGLGRRAA